MERKESNQVNKQTNNSLYVYVKPKLFSPSTSMVLWVDIVGQIQALKPRSNPGPKEAGHTNDWCIKQYNWQISEQIV